MIREHEINKETDKFICGYYTPDEVLNPIIDWCNTLDLKHGMTMDTDGSAVQWDGESEAQKECFENCITWPTLNVPGVEIYLSFVQSALELYTNKYKPLRTGGIFKMDPQFNYQKYPLGKSYNGWHSERASLKSSNRMLVWMMFLNDCEDGGETGFLYQNLKIKPEKGLLVFWPSDYTHTHRGLPSFKTEKQILTGWYSYIESGINLQWT